VAKWNRGVKCRRRRIEWRQHQSENIGSVAAAWREGAAAKATGKWASKMKSSISSGGVALGGTHGGGISSISRHRRLAKALIKHLARIGGALAWRHGVKTLKAREASKAYEDNGCASAAKSLKNERNMKRRKNEALRRRRRRRMARRGARKISGVSKRQRRRNKKA